MSFPFTSCCNCETCSVAFICFMDEADELDWQIELWDNMRCGLDEDIFHKVLPTSETGLGTDRRCGLEVFVNTDYDDHDGDTYEEPTPPGTCYQHDLQRVIIDDQGGPDDLDFSSRLLTLIESRFGATQWTNDSGVLVNNPHPQKIVIVMGTSQFLTPWLIWYTLGPMYQHYWDRGYNTQELLDQKFVYGHMSACSGSKDQYAERPSPDGGQTDFYVWVGDPQEQIDVTIEGLADTPNTGNHWHALAAHMETWVFAYS